MICEITSIKMINTTELNFVFVMSTNNNFLNILIKNDTHEFVYMHIPYIYLFSFFRAENTGR